MLRSIVTAKMRNVPSVDQPGPGAFPKKSYQCLSTDMARNRSLHVRHMTFLQCCEPVARLVKHRLEIGRRQRPAVQVALRLIATQMRQQIELLGCFHALGEGRHVEGL